MMYFKLALISSVFFCATGVLAQPATTAPKRDSLFAQMRNMPDDSLKVRRLNELSALSIKNAPQIALIYAESAIAIAEEIHDERGLIASYTSLGVVSQYLGQMDQAIEYFSKSLQLSNKPTYKKLKMALLCNMGSFFLDQYDLLTARQYATQSLALARETSDSVGVALALNSLAAVEQQAGNPEAAILLSRRAAAIFEAAGDAYQAALVYTDLAQQLVALHRYDEALAICSKVLDIQQKNNDLRAAGSTFRTIAVIHARQNRPEEALQTALQAEALFRKVDNGMSLATSLVQVGTLFLDKGSLKDAMPRFEEAKNIYQAIDNQEMQSAATLEIARAYRFKKDYERALLEANNGLVQARSLEAFDIVVSGEVLSANILADLKRYPEALERLERCKAFFDQKKARPENHPEVYESLYLLHTSMGKPDLAAEAKATWEKLKGE